MIRHRSKTQQLLAAAASATEGRRTGERLTAARAIEAAAERLRALAEDEEPRLQGAASEAAAAARELPHQMMAGFRRLAATGALQRRWDDMVKRAEASSETGEDALLSALAALLDDAAKVAGQLLEEREVLLRQRVAAASQERTTLEWVVSEATCVSSRPPPAPPRQESTDG